jgi:hypothetical protein
LDSFIGCIVSSHLNEDSEYQVMLFYQRILHPGGSPRWVICGPLTQGTHWQKQSTSSPHQSSAAG